MTYKELGKKVLEQAKKPLSAKEIWEEACKMGWDKERPSIGKTPWSTIGSDLGKDKKQFYVARKEGGAYFYWLKSREGEFPPQETSNTKEKDEIAHPIFKSQDQLFTLYQGDCNEVLPQFENRFDLIFADPPYFLSNDGLSIQSGKIVSVNKGDWDKEGSVNDIDEFNYQWINNAKKALKNTGSLLISGTYHNIFSLGRILQKLDFKILNLITWQKTNPPAQF